MTRRDLESIASRWVAVWSTGRVDDLDLLHSADFVDRSSSGRGTDLASFKQGVRDLFAAFPDLTTVVDDLVIDVDRSQVAARWSATGTHRGSFLGAAPTGRVIRFRGIEIIRIVDGRICERWGEWDGLDLLDQVTKS